MLVLISLLTRGVRVRVIFFEAKILALRGTLSTITSLLGHFGFVVFGAQGRQPHGGLNHTCLPRRLNYNDFIAVDARTLLAAQDSAYTH